MIHVIDDSKNEKRNFTFSRSLLVRYMKYFDRCLKKISDNEEIDIWISVSLFKITDELISENEKPSICDVIKFNIVKVIVSITNWLKFYMVKK